MKRFGLKTVLILVAFVGVGIVNYPKIHRHFKWRNTRNELMSWSSNLSREDGNIESYWHIDLRFVDSNSGVDLVGSSFAVLTGKPEKTIGADGRVDWGIHVDSKPDPKRFFVIPPGKWVNSIDDVIETWDNFTKLAPTL